jgi:hypothetical protein
MYRRKAQTQLAIVLHYLLEHALCLSNIPTQHLRLKHASSMRDHYRSEYARHLDK